MKLPKIPIDYSKAGSGEAPFDGGIYLFHFNNGDIITCRWDDKDKLFAQQVGSDWFFDFLDDAPKNEELPHYYTPMPEFYEEGGEA